jgi:hypothetical protein
LDAKEIQGEVEIWWRFVPKRLRRRITSNAEDEFLESGRIWLVNRSEVVNIDRPISPWYSIRLAL